MNSELRLVRDTEGEERKPFHIVSNGDNKALCGKDCTHCTYYILNFTEAGRKNICSLCLQIYLQEYAE